MRAFTVTAHSVTVGVRVNPDPYPHVRMGEPGDFQTSLWIPLDRHDWETPPRRLMRCCPKLLPPKGNRADPTLFLAAEKPLNKQQVILENERRQKKIYPHTIIGDDDDALVLVDIRGKPGGETVWSTARTAPRICPLRGHNGGTYNKCPLCGQLFEHGRHPNTGRFLDYGSFPPHLVEVIKAGHVRYKEHPEWNDMSEPKWNRVFFLRLKPHAVFRVHRGYDKGQANERFIRWTGEHMELGTKEELLDERPVIEDEPKADAVHSLDGVRA